MPESNPVAPDRRFKPLTGGSVLVSPQRVLRPWQGSRESAAPPPGPAHDPAWYLCPGNLRVGGQRDPAYTVCHVFQNDFPALLVTPAAAPADSGSALLQAEAVAGVSRVICYSPDHSKTMPELPLPAVEAIVDTWRAQTLELGRRWAWVQVFENKGEAMGCSNPHPHGQVWAIDFVPDEAAREDATQRAYFARHGRAMLLDLAALEAERGERVVVQTARWLAVVPWWAAWPFETLLLPRQSLARMSEIDAETAADLALALRELTTWCNNLFDTPFPYSMGWHGAPTNSVDAADWQLHAHFYPPLLRSAQVRKFMVGYEMLAQPQSDLTLEPAAVALRATATTHFRAAPA